MLFLHCEVTLKTIINRNSVRIHISEEKVPPVKRFAHIRQCTACQIRIKPADSAYKKLCPIMFAYVVRSSLQSRFPLCGNPCDAAQCNEQQGLNSAISSAVQRTVFRKVVDACVVTNKTIVRLRRNIIVYLSCLAQIVGLRSYNFLAQGLKLLREHHVWYLFLHVLRRKCTLFLCRQVCVCAICRRIEQQIKIAVSYRIVKLIFQCKHFSCLSGFFKINSWLCIAFSRNGYGLV